MKYRTLPAEVTLYLGKPDSPDGALLYLNSPELSAETLQALTEALVALARVTVLLLSLLAELAAAPVEVGRWAARADTLDLALASAGLMCVGMGMLLVSVYLP